MECFEKRLAFITLPLGSTWFGIGGEFSRRVAPCLRQPLTLVIADIHLTARAQHLPFVKSIAEMPLHIADKTFTGSTPKPEEIKHDYLIFYSSIVDGQLWCPDCRIVDGLLRDTFGSDESPSALIVYVGDRPTWKTPANEFRGEPWKIKSIPTIVKLKDGAEASRLVDSEISAGLQEFINST